MTIIDLPSFQADPARYGVRSSTVIACDFSRRIVLIGTAAGSVTGARSYNTLPVPEDTLVIHGEVDETVALANVMAWAAPQELPVVVVPGADHFFHGKLHIIRKIVERAWSPL